MCIYRMEWDIFRDRVRTSVVAVGILALVKIIEFVERK